VFTKLFEGEGQHGQGERDAHTHDYPTEGPGVPDQGVGKRPVGGTRHKSAEQSEAEDEDHSDSDFGPSRRPAWDPECSLTEREDEEEASAPEGSVPERAVGSSAEVEWHGIEKAL
jgi:hypothetical protein